MHFSLLSTLLQSLKYSLNFLQLKPLLCAPSGKPGQPLHVRHPVTKPHFFFVRVLGAPRFLTGADETHLGPLPPPCSGSRTPFQLSSESSVPELEMPQPLDLPLAWLQIHTAALPPTLSLSSSPFVARQIPWMNPGSGSLLLQSAAVDGACYLHPTMPITGCHRAQSELGGLSALRSQSHRAEWC